MRSTRGEPEESVFHIGEQAAQARAGVGARIEEVGRHIIRDFMPDQHRELFQQLPMLIVGSLDAQGRPWASILVGSPGFIASPDAHTLRIRALPLPGDPLAAGLRVGAPLGLLGIELETRRRNRMNGIVVAADANAFSVRVQQSFGNCPKYIQARTPRWVAAPETSGAGFPLWREGRVLSAAARALIRRADTFFIATAAPAGGSAAHGVDVSHRGGRPGFVRMTAEPPPDRLLGQEGEAERHATLLTIPDFLGNYLFNTVGNVMANPRAGLLFVDFDSGDLLALTGGAEVVWDGPELKTFTGAQRLLHIRVAAGWRAQAALPLRWSPPEFSPHLETE